MAVNMGFGGTVVKTADGYLFSAGDACRVYGMHIISGAGVGGGGVVELLDGGSSGTSKIKETGTANSGFTPPLYENGMRFDTDCYVNVDANVESVSIQCIKEL